MSDSSNQQDTADKHESEERQRVDPDQRKKLDEKPRNDQGTGDSEVSIQPSVSVAHFGGSQNFALARLATS